jgi:hypothetical protein
MEPCPVRVDEGHLGATFSAVLRLHEEAVESIEERVEGAHAEDDRVASRRPLRGEDVAALVFVDHFRACGFRGRHLEGCTERDWRGPAVGHKAIAGRAERWLERASQAQVVAPIATEGFRQRRYGGRDASMKDNQLAVRGP